MKLCKYFLYWELFQDKIVVIRNKKIGLKMIQEKINLHD